MSSGNLKSAETSFSSQNTIAKEPESESLKVILKTTAPIATKKIPSKLSIFNAMQKSEEQAEESIVTKKEDLPSHHFTETDLQTEWQKFLEEIRIKDSTLFNAINPFRLHKKDESIIEIAFSSDYAKKEFEKIKGDFFNHFMRKVNHFNLEIEFKKDENIKQEILTNRNKFDKFAEINPVLRDLDDLFKFDFS